jgi:hypothetical protein
LESLHPCHYMPRASIALIPPNKPSRERLSGRHGHERPVLRWRGLHPLLRRALSVVLPVRVGHSGVPPRSGVPGRRAGITRGLPVPGSKCTRPRCPARVPGLPQGGPHWTSWQVAAASTAPASPTLREFICFALHGPAARQSTPPPNQPASHPADGPAGMPEQHTQVNRPGEPRASRNPGAIQPGAPRSGCRDSS